MKTYLAVIDMGTNTFHLLIWEIGEEGFCEVFRKRIFVNLAEDGIRILGNKPIQRGLRAIDIYVQELKRFPCCELRIIGTEAMRTATNGHDFAKVVFNKTGQFVEIIDGNHEANLIFKGTSQIVNLSSKSALIMDIGGGSVEFILSNNGKAIWWKSFKIGVSILYRKFHNSEPISTSDLSNLRKYIHRKLKPFIAIIAEKKVNTLIGASGSFEVIEHLIGIKTDYSSVKEYSYKQLFPLLQSVVSSTLEERKAMDNLPKERIKLIVVAFVLIEEVMKIIDIDSIQISPFALKEGVLSEMIAELKA